MEHIWFDLPEDVLYIINRLLENGHQGYIVGGCIRDMLLNISPDDYDIATDALPYEIISIFQNKSNNLILNGIKHGTVGVYYRGNVYEITTFRIDGEYKDNRRPEQVEFTTKLDADLNRRDFTINAMAYNENTGLIDRFNGLEDLNNKVIRTVGEPNKRFSEDALRLMRAMRFAAKYKFTIDGITLAAMKDVGHNINKIAMERIQSEFNKILLYDPRYILKLRELNILEYFPWNIVEVDKFFLNLERCVSSAFMAKCDLKLRLAIVFQHVNETKALLKSMKYDNRTIKYVESVVENIAKLDEMRSYKADDLRIKIKEMLRGSGVEVVRDVVYINKLNEQSLSLTTEKIKKEAEGKINYYKKVEKVLNSVIDNKECFSKEELSITGKDLCSIGIKGAEVGRLLNYLLDQVIRDNTLNKKELLISMSKHT